MKWTKWMKHFRAGSIPSNIIHFNYQRALVPYLLNARQGIVHVRGDNHNVYDTDKSIKKLTAEWTK